MASMLEDHVDRSAFRLDQLDDATADLILQLQQDDLEDIQRSSKGKGRQDEITDAEYTLGIFEDELQQLRLTLADRSMSRSLSQAIISDSTLLVEEVTLARDRALAERLHNGNETACDEQIPASTQLDELLVARLTSLYISRNHGAGTQSDELNLQCISCRGSTRPSEIFRAPCSHLYCQDCLNELFELSTTDETLFPPRCCRQEMSLLPAKLYLRREVIEIFSRKSIEIRTANRVYCSNPRCSTFLGSSDANEERVACDICSTHTCTICKGGAHDGNCPDDTTTQQVLEAAREQGWQRCYQCRRLVELDVGCNHMTCHCGAQFCYTCGARWKTCPCDQWNEARLVARAEQVVARNQPVNAIPNARQHLQVQEAVEHLRHRHNCEHENWRFVAGPHQCEECYYNLPQYIFECRQCRIRACNRCKRNRL